LRGQVCPYVAVPLSVLALVGTDSATADLLAGSDAIVLDIDDEAGAELARLEGSAAARAGAAGDAQSLTRSSA
jgi:hypothetical protein